VAEVFSEGVISEYMAKMYESRLDYIKEAEMKAEEIKNLREENEIWKRFYFSFFIID
jgi:hypothetical protein